MLRVPERGVVRVPGALRLDAAAGVGAGDRDERRREDDDDEERESEPDARDGHGCLLGEVEDGYRLHGSTLGGGRSRVVRPLDTRGVTVVTDAETPP